ncbi:MAG: PH domain-containing protein [Clostridiales bacterium]|nr:PH domain-containing protein [Clostridiales bacterium]
MRYIENRLPAKERIVAKAKFSAWVFMREVLLAAVLAAGIFLAYTYLHIELQIVYYLAGAGGGFVLLVLILHIISRAGYEFLLTEKRLTGRIGFFNLCYMDTQLAQVNNLFSRASLLGRIFGYGTVYVTIQNNTFRYKNVVRPDAFVSKVSRTITRSKASERGEQLVVKFGLTSDKNLAAFKQRKKLPMDPATQAALKKEIKK